MCSRIQSELNAVYVILVMKINFFLSPCTWTPNSHKILSLSLSLIFFYKPTRMKGIWFTSMKLARHTGEPIKIPDLWKFRIVCIVFFVFIFIYIPVNHQKHFWYSVILNQIRVSSSMLSFKGSPNRIVPEVYHINFVLQRLNKNVLNLR